MMFKKYLPTSITLSKRQKFIFSTLVLAIGLLSIQLANIGWRYQAIAILTVLTWIFAAWSLRPGLDGIEWVTVLTLPTFYTAGVGLFYFLLPSGWMARVPVVLVYALGLYVLLLTENIFSVATIRTIQLLRAAHAVGFLLTLVTAFFIYDTILSFRLDAWFNLILVMFLSFPLLFSALWTVNLREKVSREVWLLSLVLSLVLGEIALVLSFWPVTVVSGSLFLVTGMYLLLGLSQLELAERLFRRSINEYLSVGIVVLITMLLTTSWGG